MLHSGALGLNGLKQCLATILNLKSRGWLGRGKGYRQGERAFDEKRDGGVQGKNR